jgi:predicted phospho-2-dehydro-3-deoxyheptonate aldolase
MIGKEKRLNRIFNKSGNLILIPIDHGVTLGPIKGIEDVNSKIKTLTKTGIDSIILHKGLIKNNYNQLCSSELGLIMHLSASTTIGTLQDYKVNVATVDEAIAMGCDGVSIHVNIGGSNEDKMLKDFSNISKACYEKGMPLLAMMYARGECVKNGNSTKNIKHIARVAEELGADIVKVSYSGDIDSFAEVIDGCSIPVVIAGGDKIDEKEFLQMVSDVMKLGARGISVGRNVFQSDNINYLLKRCNEIVHNNNLNGIDIKSIEEWLRN